MKKIISMCLAVIFILSLTGCGRNGTDNNSTVNGNTNSNTSSGLMSDAESSLNSMTDGVDSAVTSGAKVVEDEMTLTAKISAKQAREIALKHAGLSESQATDIDTDLDRDNGVLKYEIDFNSNGVEYDYDINAQTGEIISADRDTD